MAPKLLFTSADSKNPLMALRFGILTTVFWMMAGLAVLPATISKSGFGGLWVPEFTTAPFRFATQDCTGILLPLFLITDVWVVYILRRMLDRRIPDDHVRLWTSHSVQLDTFDYLSDRLLTSLIDQLP